MIEENNRPNPDEILKAIKKQELQNQLGKLKIFFGMAAGVGKTYAMLQEAQQRQKEETYVVVGTINTHGRKETESLLEGLHVIPEKWMKYKDTVFEEMDLQTILSLRPQLVLVDELAHTNVPGSKHPKRWQDVLELLDNGIDVYTTLNVQHLESRKDMIESLTGIQVRETVPDLVLERATSIELIDIPPEQLLQRMKEGKVYLAEQSRLAAENFFREENLMMLREIALRFTAEKVDHDLHGILQGKGWKTRERLMVAISASPSSEELIRAARRMAFELDSPWLAVHVETNKPLNEKDRSRLNRYFNLARELGAEVLTTYDIDIAEALRRISTQKNITRLIIGRQPSHHTFFKNPFKASLIEKIERQNKHLDFLILRQNKIKTVYQRSLAFNNPFVSSWKEYALALISGIIVTALGFIIRPFVGYKAAGFMYLLGIVTSGLYLRAGPIFFAAAFGALCWAFFFIPPLFNVNIHESEDLILVIVYFCTAAILGLLTRQMQQKEQLVKKREENIERLYAIELDIANATTFEQMRLDICAKLENFFPGKFEILTQNLNRHLIMDSSLNHLKQPKERAAAEWVFQNGKIAGWGTDTLPSVEGLYFPLKLSQHANGVFIYYPYAKRTLLSEDINFLQTVAQQLSAYLERRQMEERAIKQDYTNEIERIHRAIFHSLNRSFYRPLETLIHATHQLKRLSHQDEKNELISQIERLVDKLKLIVSNIIAISELESGFIKFNRKRQALKDLIEQSLKEVFPFIQAHKIECKLPSQLALFPFDFNLLKVALNNLLLNAFEYSADATIVKIEVEILEKYFCLSVTDEGEGISEHLLPLIFDKFYHTSPHSIGLGLGLAIVKSVVDIHRGKIEVHSQEHKGTRICLFFPITD